ncbi:hypothetical protein K439DRAFT_1635295 [Ramaria rubella]|nr:hypothetical protein K439DRAFT_1635295 [Ramaria rubella]
MCLAPADDDDKWDTGHSTKNSLGKFIFPPSCFLTMFVSALGSTLLFWTGFPTRLFPLTSTSRLRDTFMSAVDNR